jgi:hypothetical protein
MNQEYVKKATAAVMDHLLEGRPPVGSRTLRFIYVCLHDDEMMLLTVGGHSTDLSVNTL